MRESEGDNHGFLLVKCPSCGYEIRFEVSKRSGILFSGLIRARIRSPIEGEQIQSYGDAAFLNEASKRGWSVFKPVTPDVGVDYIVAKEYAAVMVQLKTATMMEDERYHVTVDKFLEGPFGVIIYYFADIKAFFVIPSAEFWEIPRFKALKPKVFATGSYSDKLSYEKAKEVMGEYENEKGWERLEQLTHLDGLLEALRSFIDKHKEEKT
jgi:hypothetical protein